jgi:NAD(P)-dependent dehydrogenase (short-subunit alcohol dehydrogenase family)
MMMGTTINRVQTLYKILAELSEYGLIEWQRGSNRYEAAKYKIIKLTKTARVNVPLAARVNAIIPATLYETLSATLPANLTQTIYIQLIEKLNKCLINNIKTIKENQYLIQIRKI